MLGPLLPRRAAPLDFDTLLAESLGTGLPFLDPAALRLSGVPLPAPGQVLPPDGRAATVGSDVLGGQAPLAAPVLLAPPYPAGTAEPQFEGAQLPPRSGEQSPASSQPVPADPRLLPASGTALAPGAEPPPPPTTEPVLADSVATTVPPSMTAAAVAATGGVAADAVDERRKHSVAPGSAPAPEASVARPVADEVPAPAAAERKEADSQPGQDRQATDAGLLAAQSALRPERALSRDAPDATPEPARDGIKEQVGSPRWQHELGQRLVTLAGQGVREVRLQLHPEHLGPVEVRITLHDSQVGLWFGAQHAETRDALEHSLPRLREMFTQGGLTMTDASVAQHHQDRGSQTATAREPTWDAPVQSGAMPAMEPVRSPSANQVARLVDEYA